MNSTALILVDLQRDFTQKGTLTFNGKTFHYEEGRLGVKGGYEIIPLINQYMKQHPDRLVVASQDWHPKNHGSFASNHPENKPFDVIKLHGLDQVLWPDHCIQDSNGAKYLQGLDETNIAFVVKKGANPDVDSYSAFFDNGGINKTTLDNFLKEKNIADIEIVGIATDYCVLYTALDALKLGFKVTVYEDMCRGVDPESTAKAIATMKNAGIIVRAGLPSYQ